MHRLLIAALFVAASALVWGAAQAAPAAKEGKSHEGKVVSVAEGKLVMTDKEGKNEHTHQIGASAKITLDGKAAKLADLKKGDSVKVTTDDTGKVLSVEAKRA